MAMVWKVDNTQKMKTGAKKVACSVRPATPAFMKMHIFSYSACLLWQFVGVVQFILVQSTILNFSKVYFGY